VKVGQAREVLLETRAQFDGRERTVHIRINERAGHIYLENDGPGSKPRPTLAMAGAPVSLRPFAGENPSPLLQLLRRIGLAANDAACYQKHSEVAGGRAI